MLLTLQFSCQDDFGSTVIRFFSHGAWSHVDLVLDDGRLLGARSDVCKGVPSGVQIRPKDYTAFKARRIVSLNLTDEQYKKAMDFINSQIGKPYDSIAILAFALNRNWRDDDAWFCDELILRMLEVCNFFSFKLCLAANKMTPDDLLLALSAVMPV